MARPPEHYPSARLRAFRRALVSEMYRKGHSFSQIRDRVRAEQGLERTSISTIHTDVQGLLAEWRAERLANMDAYVTLELRRIHDATAALWAEWERSKQGGARPAAVGYMAEIRQQLAERRKLLGLYAPERREVSGPGGAAVAVQALSEEDILREIERIASGLPAAGASVGAVGGADGCAGGCVDGCAGGCAADVADAADAADAEADAAAFESWGDEGADAACDVTAGGAGPAGADC